MLQLGEKKFLVFDGAMGTMLQKAGLRLGEVPESYNIAHPEVVRRIHREYVEAGSDVVTTNTFGANRYKLSETLYSVKEVVKAAVSLAKKSEARFVVQDIGPIGQMLSPIGTLSFEEAYDIFKEQVKAGVAAGVDAILIETIADLYEARAAILAAKENSDLPVLCTMTFEDKGRTLTGTDPETMVHVLEGIGVDALGVNCSLGLQQLHPIVDCILAVASVPVIVQPNAGLPRMVAGETLYDLSPQEFATETRHMAEKGAVIVGGCCGTTPEYIAEVSRQLRNLKPRRPHVKRLTCTCSATKTITIGDDVTIIGERINPTGKERLKQALLNHDMDYIVSEAIRQKETGSHILDINVGLPGGDERELMKSVVTELQAVVDTPLQIDSTSAEVIETAVRLYNGKPVINSVNGKKTSMESLFPIAAKYGALIIGLTLDEKGIPDTAEERVKIAEKIIETASTYGIPQENILIDCLALTAATNQASIMETLKAMTIIKEKYRVKTVLGTSNTSYGLPNRPLLNAIYLTMALSLGLNAPITDSTSDTVMNAIKAYRVLANHDKECGEYVMHYGHQTRDKTKKTEQERDLKEAIALGLREEAKQKTKILLKTTEAMDIINLHIIPALDSVGLRHETGEVFLPQLMRSADAAKSAFDVLKEHIGLGTGETVSKGRILLATVRGDVHDIGKNIVKILLENYGFEVIDLGTDVAAKRIVQAAYAHNVDLVGLSALMTTTVGNMEETIAELKRSGYSGTIMIGGAVLSEEDAKRIGAHSYGKDAQEAVRIAQRYLQ